MKKKLLIALAAIIFTAVFLCSAIVAFDGNDYGGGGGNSGGSSGGSFFSSGSSGGGTLTSGGIIAVIVIIIVIIIFNKIKGNSAVGGTIVSGSGSQGANVNLPDRTLQIEQIIKQDDPNFSAGDFISFSKQVYIDIEDAWCKRDLKPVRPVMHENLYNTTNRQVQAKIEQGVVFHYESIAINTAYLTSYAKDTQFEYLTAYLNARMIDYQVDEKTGNIIRGDKTTRWDMRYKMKFVRSIGVKTREETGSASGHNCPNCGAPLEMTSSGVCDYCGSVVTTGMYSWVLTDFTTVRDDTRDEGISVPPAQS